MLARRAAGIAGAHWLSRASQAAPFRALGGRERGFIGPERRGQRRKRRQLRRTLACEHEAVIAPAAAAAAELEARDGVFRVPVVRRPDEEAPRSCLDLIGLRRLGRVKRAAIFCDACLAGWLAGARSQVASARG